MHELTFTKQLQFLIFCFPINQLRVDKKKTLFPTNDIIKQTGTKKNPIRTSWW